MKNKKHNNKQKRSIEIIEYENGKWKIIGSGWDLNLNKNEIDKAFLSWRTGILKEECSIKLKLPKILKN